MAEVPGTILSFSLFTSPAVDGFTEEVLSVLQEELPTIMLCAAGVKLPMDM